MLTTEGNRSTNLIVFLFKGEHIALVRVGVVWTTLNYICINNLSAAPQSNFTTLRSYIFT